MTRRRFLKLLAATAALAVSGSGYTRWLEPGWLEVTRVNVLLPNLAPGLDGLTICQISDLHFGSFVKESQLRHIVEVARTLSAHLVVVTGDYVIHSAQDAYLCAAELAHLRLPPAEENAPLDVCTILGNHDHWTDAETVATALQEAGLTLLRNTGRLIEINHAALWLAGVDDIWEEKADLVRALADAPANVPIVLLAHEPDFADVVARGGRVSMQLSGHSHGGQVRLPFLGAPILPYLGHKYPYGLRRVGEMWLYTNRGVGTIFPPVRLNCRPEITLLTLSR